LVLERTILSRRTCQCGKCFLAIPCDNSLITFKALGPTFLEQHDPNLTFMWFCKAWTCTIGAGEAIIGLNVLPLSVEKEFEHEVVGRVLLE
jgi:hypothetical protein